jgi:membrane protease YdiL (CAAX protease family)
MAGLAAGANGKGAWRAPLAIVALLGLVGVVAIAAAGRAPAGGESRPSGHAPTLLVDYISTIALLFVPVGVILIIWAAFARRQRQQAGIGKRGRGRTLVTVVLVVIVLGGAAVLRSQFPSTFNRRSANTSTAPGQTTTKKGASSKPAQTPQAHFRWLPLVILGSLVVAFGGAAGYVAYRRRYGILPEGPTAAEVSAVLTETLDDLYREPDPRKAVIAAYAKMERSLAVRGMPREPSEAPLEYLERILDYVQASSHSVRRLTKLFARARFSPHEIDVPMKNDAIEALKGLRADLEVAG